MHLLTIGIVDTQAEIAGIQGLVYGGDPVGGILGGAGGKGIPQAAILGGLSGELGVQGQQYCLILIGSAPEHLSGLAHRLQAVRCHDQRAVIRLIIFLR